MIGDDLQRPAIGRIAQRRHAAHPHALALEAAILSLIRSAVTSRSNWANESSMLSVSRPMLVVVLSDWVIETNELRRRHGRQRSQLVINRGHDQALVMR